jgi:drug/metabolite transporter (DMT)-like permease
MTAVIGSWFFHEALGVRGYISVVLGVAGVLVASKWQIGVRNREANRSIVYSIGAGLGFALASLWLREGMLSLDVPAIASAAYALLFMVFIQTIFCSVWVLVHEPWQLRVMRKKWAPCLFIGFTSVAGSVGWFTAMSLQNAALVRTLGQTEFLAALAITHFYFGESISRREYAGVLLVIASVILLIGGS